MERYPVEHGARSGESIILLHGGNVGNWMWEPQVEGLAGRHVITPDVVAFSSRSAEPWPGLRAAADDIAGIIRACAIDGRAHVVGLSMGGVIGVHLAMRHPDVVRSCMVTGAMMTGVGGFERRLAELQLRFWDRRWFWSAQATMFRIPSDARGLFISDGMGVDRAAASGMYREIFDGSMPEGRSAYSGPMLAIAGERESKSVVAAFPALVAAMPQTRTWIAPRMRHVWNIQDADLFTKTIVDFVDRDVVPPTPRTPPPR
ncbi:alpha/beta fold hydrolase [Microbacterium abyssi]|uniref:alpha/beta fold hydrolase n=1 Tax=Microbacterium abyssi TaxID=2782166 RepID=UPI0018876184|nr:alpha/beta hydrolase [Microbacterium sp. A18JL241]